VDRRIDEKRQQVAAILPRILRSLAGAVPLGDDFDPVRSDLDLVVDFEPLPEGTYANTYFVLIAALERIFQRPVDLRNRPSISRASYPPSALCAKQRAGGPPATIRPLRYL